MERIAAPAERGILPGARAVAIGTRQALEAGRVAGGGAGIGHGGAVARDTPRLSVRGSPIGAFGRLPCRGKPGQAGDRGAAAVCRPAGAHGPGFLDLAGDLRLKLGLSIERAGHRLGALRRITRELAGLQAQSLDDGGFHDVDFAGETSEHAARLGPVVVGRIARRMGAGGRNRQRCGQRRGKDHGMEDRAATNGGTHCPPPRMPRKRSALTPLSCRMLPFRASVSSPGRRCSPGSRGSREV